GLTGDGGMGPRRREVVTQGRVGQGVVVVGPGLVVVLQGRHDGVREDRREPFEATTGTRHQAPIGSANPTTLPFLLILVGAGIPLPRPGSGEMEGWLGSQIRWAPGA